MKKIKHEMICAAPICMSDKSINWQKKVVWYPGEKICDKRPFTKVQKKQAKINKYIMKNRIKTIDQYFTADTLNNTKDIPEKLLYPQKIEKKPSKRIKSTKKKIRKTVSRTSSKNKHKVIKTGSRLRKTGIRRKSAMRYSKI